MSPTEADPNLVVLVDLDEDVKIDSSSDLNVYVAELVIIKVDNSITEVVAISDDLFSVK